MEKAGVGPAKDIDMLIYATLSPDNNFPGTGVFTQRLLGLREVPCYDIRQQCTGFLYGLAMADAFIKSGQYKHILVIGSEVHSTGSTSPPTGATWPCCSATAPAAHGGRPRDRRPARDPVDPPARRRHRRRDPVDRVPGQPQPPAASPPRPMAERKHYPAMQGKKVFKHAVTKHAGGDHGGHGHQPAGSTTSTW
jgi:3-oxoacyl-[acyl-carrier-protein] synthase-3